MGFYRPYKHRHLPRDPGPYTYAIVGWVLVTLMGAVMGVVFFVVGAVFYLTVR